MDLSALYCQVIKDHNLSRHNKHELDGASIVTPGKNPSCGDEIELSLLLGDDGRIQDAAFHGEGCAISQASVSIMIDLVRDKTLDEAAELCALFLDMIRGEEQSEEAQDRLEEALALRAVAQMPARVKCATMPWHTLEEAVKRLTVNG